MLHTAQLESKAKTPASAPAAHKSEGTADLDLVFKDMNGAEVRLADYKGKVILLNVWATWCGPCELEIPELVEAYAKYKDQGVVVLWDDKFDDAYGPIVGVPITFFIGRDGMISRRHFGPVTKERIDQEIKALL
ncbi:MAG: TlpA family protein disulfide reductase [Acidobacteria bacterium]|nr:TlpA family protein disulfide reductase [Acidobacteriota bacterium]